MYLKIAFSVIASFLFIGCKQGISTTEKTQTTVKDSVVTIDETDTTFIEEYFADSISIGIKNKNKIELTKYRSTDSVYAIIKFFIKAKKRWQQVNEFVLPKDGVLACSELITDYNNDGYNDFSFVSSIAGRGANEVRTLFVYDKITDRLVHIKNSDNYPNLQYNKELNCIDAFLVYGGSMSVFLRIVGDSLKPFASVELYDGLEVKEYDRQGNEKIILRDTSIEARYVRYRNYKPLVVYDEY